MQLGISSRSATGLVALTPRQRLVLQRSARVAIDLMLVVLAYVIATVARFDGAVPPDRMRQMLLVLPLVLVVKSVAKRATGVHRASWRASSLGDLGKLVIALAAASLCLLLVRATAEAWGSGPVSELLTIPYGIIAIDFVCAVVALGGARAIRRSLVDRSSSRVGHRSKPSEGTVLVGAGKSGAAVARELRRRSDLGLAPVGFLDDDRGMQGRTVQLLPVLGRIDELAAVAREVGATTALLTISRPPGTLVRRVREQCEQAGLKLRTIPGLSEIAGGQVNLSRIRPVELEDLLRREPVETDVERIKALVHGRAVMVTGAGGSIGAELCRQLLAMEPAALVMVERAENALYEIHHELDGIRTGSVLFACIADIGEPDRILDVLATHRPAVVFHAAAHKHVPMMEYNPAEALKNNVLGTQRLVDACVAEGVERFVLISTDKAVNPSSVMGASKRLAERYVIATAQETGLAYSAVRFGNVLGSNGSVVPLFRRQLANGGPITVTDPEVRRYFMTIPEAVQLVLQTAVMGCGGDIFVLDMGEQIKIVDLAHDLITLSGLEVDRDIEIHYVGLREGEKLYEELALDSEEMTATQHEKIFCWQGPIEVPIARLRADFASMELDLSDPRRHVRRLVPEYEQPSRDRVIQIPDPGDGGAVNGDMVTAQEVTT